MNTKAKQKQPETPEEALASFLGIDLDEVNTSSHRQYDMPIFEVGNQEYLVCTDEEADAAVKEYIEQSVWAFNASFLASMTGVPEEAFSSLGTQCESANDWVLHLIEKTCSIDDFVEAAVSADGRGHFLSGYDGNENESGEYYIYRTN